MAQLAIKGHATRGKEVIKLLEILGGYNAFDFDGTELNRYYYIDNINDKIYHCLSVNSDYGVVFTLEEFEEKFPYKVGDKVIIRKSGIIYTISQMLWKNGKIIYLLDNCGGVWFSDELQLYKEKNMKEKNNDNWAKWDLPDGYEFQDKDGNIINTSVIKLVKKQSKYPKTYEECCDVLGMLDNRGFGLINLSECENILISHFIQLKRCRDAYWKIAGEQMGLGKPWEPDWTDEFTISNKCDKKYLYNTVWYEEALSFPTEEMRDAFYENFKDLIEECKELL